MAMDDAGPKRTDKPETTVDLTDKLLPWREGQPVMLAMPGTDLMYLPLFSTEGQLRSLLERAGVPFESIKRVEDGWTFLHSFYVDNPWARKSIAVILDPYFLDNGRVRFVQVQLPGPLPSV